MVKNSEFLSSHSRSPHLHTQLRSRHRPRAENHADQSPQSNGMAEAFVRTIKRDYVRVSPCPDADTVMHQLSAWITHYNEVHPHKAESSLSGTARVGNTIISGRGNGRYIRLDPWSWLSLHRAQASGADRRRACPATDDIPALA
jgi:hypothetical protein